MLVAEIASRLDHDVSRIGLIRAPKVAGGKILFEYPDQSNKLSGNVCILDDVTRKGDTLRRISNCVFDEFQKGKNNISSKSFGVLLTVRTHEKSLEGYFNPNYSSYSVSNENVILPWTYLSSQVRNYVHRIDGVPDNLEYARRVAEFYAVMSRDMTAARACLLLSLENPDYFQRVLDDRHIEKLLLSERQLLQPQDST